MGFSIIWKEVVIHTFQKCAVSLVSCCVLPSADIGVVEIPHEVRVYEHEAAIEGHVYSVFHTGQLIEHPHYSVLCPCPPFNADPLALVQLYIHTQAELHELHLVTDNSSSSSLPDLLRICVLLLPYSNHRRFPTMSQ